MSSFCFFFISFWLLFKRIIALNKKAGVTDIVLAVNYRPEIMVDVLKKYEEKYNVQITFSVETEPLGTGQYCVALRGGRA